MLFGSALFPSVVRRKSYRLCGVGWGAFRENAVSPMRKSLCEKSNKPLLMVAASMRRPGLSTAFLYLSAIFVADQWEAPRALRFCLSF
jgi:hypothetical protein